MGQKEKLIEKLKSRSRSFTFNDATRLLGFLDYSMSNKGKTSGSRVSRQDPLWFVRKSDS